MYVSPKIVIFFARKMQLQGPPLGIEPGMRS